MMNAKLIIDRLNIMLDVDDIATLCLLSNGFFNLSIIKNDRRAFLDYILHSINDSLFKNQIPLIE